MIGIITVTLPTAFPVTSMVLMNGLPWSLSIIGPRFYGMVGSLIRMTVHPSKLRHPIPALSLPLLRSPKFKLTARTRTQSSPALFSRFLQSNANGGKRREERLGKRDLQSQIVLCETTRKIRRGRAGLKRLTTKRLNPQNRPHKSLTRRVLTTRIPTQFKAARYLAPFCDTEFLSFNSILRKSPASSAPVFVVLLQLIGNASIISSIISSRPPAHLQQHCPAFSSCCAAPDHSAMCGNAPSTAILHCLLISILSFSYSLATCTTQEMNYYGSPYLFYSWAPNCALLPWEFDGSLSRPLAKILPCLLHSSCRPKYSLPGSANRKKKKSNPK